MLTQRVDTHVLALNVVYAQIWLCSCLRIVNFHRVDVCHTCSTFVGREIRLGCTQPRAGQSPAPTNVLPFNVVYATCADSSPGEHAQTWLCSCLRIVNFRRINVRVTASGGLDNPPLQVFIWLRLCLRLTEGWPNM